MSSPAPTAYVFMGICGCGKSTVAQHFANSKCIEMLDADDFHPERNVSKMASGVALNDDDRAPWLDRLNRELKSRLENGKAVVLACSALKQKYRSSISLGLPSCEWIYLKGDRDLILDRMSLRTDHFMPTSMIDSQLATLEEPIDSFEVDISLSLDEIQDLLAEKYV